MGVKKTNTWRFNWQASTPAPYVPNAGGQTQSGVLTGAMASTNVIYSNIQDVRNTDNQGLEISWTGTAVGTIEVQGSTSGTNFYSLTFNPVLTQPAGTAGGYLIDLNQFPWPYLMIKYTNASGSGSLTAWLCSKDVN